MRWKIFSRRRARATIGPALWSQALERSAYARALGKSERSRLRTLATEFLRAKSFDGAAGFEVAPAVTAIIAVKACLPILNLGLDYYAGWSDVVIYPGEFRVQDEYTDDAGVVHRETRDLCGQSLSQGPMVLSWSTVEEEREYFDRDVIVHECAHKLDVLNGSPNGFPPLHDDMSVQRWTAAFKPAFERFEQLVEAGIDTALDPYAATDPAEFFAVVSETFFTLPAVVRRDFPAVYEELSRFYRQDPYACLGEMP